MPSREIEDTKNSTKRRRYKKGTERKREKSFTFGVVWFVCEHMRIHPAAPAAARRTSGGCRTCTARCSSCHSRRTPTSRCSKGPAPTTSSWPVPCATGGGVVRVRTVRIHPGVVKVVVQAEGAGDSEEGDADDMELDRWRSRLPEASCPAMAVAGYVDGQLVVTVPKGRDGGDGGEGEVTWRCCSGGKISGRLVVVQ